MTVADLQAFVRNLSVTLASAGAKKPADELESIAAGLEPFQVLGLAQFSNFLITAENYARTGIVPTTGKGRAKAAAPKVDSAEKVRLAGERVSALYDRAVAPDLQYTAIEAEIKALNKLTKDEAVQVARQLGIAATLKTKKAAMEEIKRKITERKESFERIQFRPQDAPGATP
jgi:hypothetical protein